MSRDPSAMFSREELLGGLNARRASTLLFAIEARTAQLVGRSREAMQQVEATDRRPISSVGLWDVTAFAKHIVASIRAPGSGIPRRE